MTNTLIDRTRAHLEECALCFASESCEAFALLHAEGQFEARIKFRLWIDNHEVLFFPVTDSAWHVRYSFNANGGFYLTPHYVGRPAGSVKTFEQAISYARANLLSANQDLLDHLRGFRPSPAMAGGACHIERESHHDS